jgi:hypothetical protein
MGFASIAFLQIYTIWGLGKIEKVTISDDFSVVVAKGGIEPPTSGL